jgi:hypothetical protein
LYFFWRFPPTGGPRFTLQSVIASGARQSFEHIASQTRNAGIYTSIANANFKFNFYLFSFSIDEKETKNLVY